MNEFVIMRKQTLLYRDNKIITSYHGNIQIKYKLNTSCCAIPYETLNEQYIISLWLFNYAAIDFQVTAPRRRETVFTWRGWYYYPVLPCWRRNWWKDEDKLKFFLCSQSLIQLVSPCRRRLQLLKTHQRAAALRRLTCSLIIINTGAAGLFWVDTVWLLKVLTQAPNVINPRLKIVLIRACY